MPKVTVIIPTYNAEKTIERAIKNVLNQTLNDFEIIIVDDASKDRTIEIIKEYQRKEKRIKLFILDKNSGGPTLPRNIGIQNANSEYITFLDSDDVYLPENLKIKSKILDKNPEINIINGWSWAVDEKRKIIDYLPPYLLSWMIRKKTLEKIGYFTQEQTGADEIGWSLRYKKLGGNPNSIFTLKEPLTLYFWHRSQTSERLRENNPFLFAMRWESLLKETTDSDSFREDRSCIYSRLGNLYCLAKELKKGRMNFRQSLNLKFNLYALTLFIVSFTGEKNYKKLARILRSFHRSIIWRGRKVLAQHKYKENYKKAVQTLRDL